MDETNVHRRIIETLRNLSSGLSFILERYSNISANHREKQNGSYTTTNATETYNNSVEIWGEANTSCDICCYYASSVQHVHISHVLCTHLSIAIIAFGLITNTLSMVTFRSKTLRTSSTVLYLFYLGLSDNIYLTVVFLTRILECLRCLYFQEVPMDLYNRSTLACQGLQYILDITSDFSTTLLLLVAIERYIACHYPMFHKKRYTITVSRVAMGSLLSIVCILVLPHHVMYVKHYADINTCDVSGDHQLEFYALYMTEVMVFWIIPTYLLAIVNILIFRKLWQRNKRVRYKQVRNDLALAVLRDVTGNVKEFVATERKSMPSVTLLTMSTFYFVCYQPIILCYVLSCVSNDYGISADTIAVFRNYARVLCILGYSTNFFWYTLSGNVFRKEFKKFVIERVVN